MGPLNSNALAMESATSLMETSLSSPTERIIGDGSSYCLMTHIINAARSLEYMNCLFGFPDPETTNSVPCPTNRGDDP